MLPELLPDEPEPLEPEPLEPSQAPDPWRWLGGMAGLVAELPGSPGICAVWHDGRGSLGAQSAGICSDSPVLPDIDPDDDEPGTPEPPWF